MYIHTHMYVYMDIYGYNQEGNVRMGQVTYQGVTSQKPMIEKARRNEAICN